VRGARRRACSRLPGNQAEPGGAQVVAALSAAGDDERVRGVVRPHARAPETASARARPGGGGAGVRPRAQVATIGGNQAFSGLAQVQELRNAVADFRQRSAGRAATVAFADAFGEAGANGTITYYLATAFERVYMQPSGLLSVSGLASSTPFLRALFDRWHVRPLFLAREEFKSVANQARAGRAGPPAAAPAAAPAP